MSKLCNNSASSIRLVGAQCKQAQTMSQFARERNLIEEKKFSRQIEKLAFNVHEKVEVKVKVKALITSNKLILLGCLSDCFCAVTP